MTGAAGGRGRYRTHRTLLHRDERRANAGRRRGAGRRGLLLGGVELVVDGGQLLSHLVDGRAGLLDGAGRGVPLRGQALDLLLEPVDLGLRVPGSLVGRGLALPDLVAALLDAVQAGSALLDLALGGLEVGVLGVGVLGVGVLGVGVLGVGVGVRRGAGAGVGVGLVGTVAARVVLPRVQHDEVGLLALLVHDAEPDVLQRPREPPGPDRGARVGVHDGGGEGLGEAVEHGLGHGTPADLARVAHRPHQPLDALAAQVVERADPGTVALRRRRAQLVAEVGQHGDLVGPVAHHLVDDPRRDRRLRQPLDPPGAEPVTVARGLPGGGVPGRDELVERPRVQGVDGVVEVGRLGGHVPTVARARRLPRPPRRPLSSAPGTAGPGTAGRGTRSRRARR
ncbi:hypothetical protein HLB15_16190 [Promicromonospora citrea]|uniref:hypothetical protein n=1 Tax=Promicromonospora citrea TaxID=43677 RepID=UPI0014889C90|nr:hypothetical protein [Promicromonospora citrea]NNH53783.1 hypothetical protein [Promicromonospora citrea]